MRFGTAVRGAGPWFREHRIAALVVSALLYVGVVVLRFTTVDASQATMLLLVLPVALLAVTFGLVAGSVGGLIAVALLVGWAAAEQVPISPVGWAARALPLLVLGVLLGYATDRLRRSEAERIRLDHAAHWHRQAVEINDSIVQGLAAAKWSLEAGHYEAGLQIVTDTMRRAESMVSQLLRDAGMGMPGSSLAALDESKRDSPRR